MIDKALGWQGEITLKSQSPLQSLQNRSGVSLAAAVAATPAAAAPPASGPPKRTLGAARLGAGRLGSAMGGAMTYNTSPPPTTATPPLTVRNTGATAAADAALHPVRMNPTGFRSLTGMDFEMSFAPIIR